MDTCQVTILPENITVTIHKGASLLTAAKDAGIDIASPCGGQGTCGKCAVKVIKGTCSLTQTNHFPQDLREAGYIPACQAVAEEDAVIEIPEFSRLTGHKVALSSRKTRFNRENDYLAIHGMNPVSRNYFIELEKPDPTDSRNDLDRLKTALFREYGLDGLQIGIDCLRSLPETIRKGNWQLTTTVADMDGWKEILAVAPGKAGKPAMGLAVDLGTTTIVVSLLNLETGKILDKAGTYNKQSVYGSDVITRIIYADEAPNGLKEMQLAAVRTINGLLTGLVKKHSLERNDITALVIGGNTVMTHLFFAVPPTHLRLEPYVPGAIRFPTVKAGKLGISIHPDAPVVSMPCVASYVGGDITAGVLATMLTHSSELTLFIDIGTNGELVLGNQEWMVTCSCSAGPAFEGSGISCGMRAMDGAIERIAIDHASYEVQCSTVGNRKPLGICGTGLIESLSEMKRAGIIDRAGQINESIDSGRVRRGDNGPEFVLVFAEQSGSGQDIAITGNDIKNLLRAKGAIFAGIRRMLQEVQLNVADIDRVYIAGGFGNDINIPDAIGIGLLPDLPEEKFEYVGNSCIQGTMLVLLCREAYREAVEISEKMTYLELSSGNLFMEEFMAAMFLPHTDLTLFPSAARKRKDKE